MWFEPGRRRALARRLALLAVIALAHPAAAGERRQAPVRADAAKTAKSAGKAAPKFRRGTATRRADAAVGAVSVESTGLHGRASFYGSGLHGRRAASGEGFDARAFTAASNRFPLGSWVLVRRLDNGRCAVVRINDRMPARQRRRIIDLSRAAAEQLDMIAAGVVLVRAARLRQTPGQGGRVAPAECRQAFAAGDESEDRAAPARGD